MQGHTDMSRMSNRASASLKKRISASPDVPKTQRATVWKAIVVSKLIHHCAAWGQLTAECLAKVISVYHKGFRTVRGFPSYGKLSVNTRTDTGVRADAGMPPFSDLTAFRRIG